MIVSILVALGILGIIVFLVIIAKGARQIADWADQDTGG